MPTRRVALRLVSIFVLLLAAWHIGSGFVKSSSAEANNPRVDSTSAADLATENLGQPAELPLPSSMSTAEYEAELFEFLKSRKYVELGWRVDKGVRDTGPYLDGTYYGTHPAVRVYYSPGVVQWLAAGRMGPIADGEMIIKEQYAPPAARHHHKSEAELRESLESWTVMVKDAAGSHDGWFWSNPAADQQVADNPQTNPEYPVSGFGMYCIRCHASTRSPEVAEVDHPHNEFTFASLRNIEGFPGHPILFRVDDSWREEMNEDSAEPDQPADGGGNSESETNENNSAVASDSSCNSEDCPSQPNAEFLSLFDSISATSRDSIRSFLPASRDWVVKKRDPSQQFITSSQCMSCHAGLAKPFGPTMFVPTGENGDYGAPGRNVSPYNEWRWTPMGLAGRDPVFHAQLESEQAMLRREFAEDADRAERLVGVLEDTCLRCHGGMGQHQFAADHAETGETFAAAQLTAAGDSSDDTTADSHYGALGRDGVSCMICHRMQPRPQPDDDDRTELQFYLDTTTTGNIHVGPPGEIYGPFKDDEISSYAMHHATGLKPKHSEYIKSSRLCGSCHTVSLPAVDFPVQPEEHDELNTAQTVPEFRRFHHHVEQATYLEWLNSEYQNEFGSENPNAKTCQDCHMSRGLEDEQHGIDLAQVRTRIATIQDTTYPDAENLASHDDLNIRIREQGYARHNFAGLNIFLLELFNQFDDVLGVNKTDFMTGSKTDLAAAIDDMVRTARRDTASIDLEVDADATGELTAKVMVANKAGHRFPTGVGFRRVFIELLVIDESRPDDDPERIVWSSGQTNSLGVLVDRAGNPLQTEFFSVDPATGQQQYQPHHEVISSPDQVQVYETLLCNAHGNFTTSFVRGCNRMKDNRLLPRGWTADGPDPSLTGRYLKATHPGDDAANDDRYTDGSGTDEVTYRIALPADIDPNRLTVRATLYYQAMPPYFLRNIFETTDGPAAQRLHYLLSHVDLAGTPIENWKLKIATAEHPTAETPLTAATSPPPSPEKDPDNDNDETPPLAQ